MGQLTHDELLAKIATMEETYTCGETLVLGSALAYNALRAVVELHKPIETYNMNNVHKSWLTCTHCDDEHYPCPTIQAITKELE